LYKIGFNPILNINDFIQFQEGKTSKDVEEQQKKIHDADTIILIHPTWWGGMPAMLKGYLDRVFTIGFAYKMGENQPVGLLGNKKVIIIRTTSLPEELYLKSGVEDLIQNLNTFKLKVVCGVKNLDHHIFYAVSNVPDETRKKYLDKVYQLSKKL
jgi:NAD(P)H dehydrogenase (quinone)